MHAFRPRRPAAPRDPPAPPRGGVVGVDPRRRGQHRDLEASGARAGAAPQPAAGGPARPRAHGGPQQCGAPLHLRAHCAAHLGHCGPCGHRPAAPGGRLAGHGDRPHHARTASAAGGLIGERGRHPAPEQAPESAGLREPGPGESDRLPGLLPPERHHHDAAPEPRGLAPGVHPGIAGAEHRGVPQVDGHVPRPERHAEAPLRAGIGHPAPAGDGRPGPPVPGRGTGLRSPAQRCATGGDPPLRPCGHHRARRRLQRALPGFPGRTTEREKGGGVVLARAAGHWCRRSLLHAPSPAPFPAVPGP